MIYEALFKTDTDAVIVSETAYKDHVIIVMQNVNIVHDPHPLLFHYNVCILTFFFWYLLLVILCLPCQQHNPSLGPFPLYVCVCVCMWGGGVNAKKGNFSGGGVFQIRELLGFLRSESCVLSTSLCPSPFFQLPSK